ncbi:Beta-cyclopiazonate dehydrogenase 2 [Paramyrothecium foliicola]|nr:Beta-cyclopiazonate dehydrogenase 2 [Paramyrothecium foliicola]
MRSPLFFLSAVCFTTLKASPVERSCPTVLERDVLVIGGGAAGAYAAVRLRDNNKTVTVVELSDKLGGHVDTFFDPASGAPIEYGVQAYIPGNLTTNFFGRFGVPLQQVPQSVPFPNVVADFNTGTVLEDVQVPDQTQLIEPLTQYGIVAAQFPFLASGAYDLPAEVPADLLLPFGQYVNKYNLTASLPLVWTFAHGVGNLLEATTLYVLQNLGLAHLFGLQTGFQFSPSGHQTIYDKAGGFLGNDVLYSSVVTECTRTSTGIRAVVKTPNGNVIVKAKKLLVTIPPTTDNLKPFSLDKAEKSIFSQWMDVPYYVGVVANSSLPSVTNFLNVDPTTPATLPQSPFVWRLETVGVPGYQTVKVIGERDSNAARQKVERVVNDLEEAVTGSSSGTASIEPWEQHKNLQLHVSAESIKAGFYQKLYALQGRSNTYYAGNAWCSDYSPLIWAYLEERILPLL